jgi:endonuclease/exonuclease/phosphatase family metal-dependent hydrolase
MTRMEARWIVFVIASIAAGTLAGLLIGCSQPPAETLRLASLNMAGGAGAEFSTDAVRAAQRQFFADHQPDVASLQEVPDDFATLLPPGSTFRAGDTAIWAREGLQLDKMQDIPLDRSVWIGGVLVSDYQGRNAAYARVTDSVTGVAITVSAVHLTVGAQDASGKSYDPTPVRAVEMEEAAVFEPDVIIGDFNALSREIGEVLGPLGYRAATTGAPDTAWLKTGERGVMEPTEGASDHPAAATVEIRRSK